MTQMALRNLLPGRLLPGMGVALLLALPAASVAFAPAALAQAGVPGVTNGVLTGPVVGAAPGPGRKEAPPPALPGAHSGDSEPAPPDRPTGDMRPNEALFDAINRGDITAARDAISRGADLGAHNVLGLTPVDLSVDLGRNDITFLLLSMRGGSSSSGGPPPAEARPPVRATAARTGQVHPAAQVAAAASRPAPQQYTDIPAPPVPQAGFLGFGGGR